MILKVEKAGIDAVNRIQNEAYWLQLLNRHSIGPQFLGVTETGVLMEYVDGVPILDYATTASREDLIHVLVDLLYQCRTLDQLGVTKEEMHRPLKHVLVRDRKVVMIDFERCRRMEKPKNVTQVCQFISKYWDFPGILDKASIYKQTYGDREFQEILQCLTNTS